MFRRFIIAVLFCCVSAVRAQYPASPQVAKDGTAVLLENYARAPLSSRTLTTYSPTNPIIFSDQLARINFLRPEPTNAPGFGTRYFVCDQNRNLYIVSKSNPLDTNNWTRYINFEEVFPRFDNDPGFAGGMNTFQFDPGYATNGIFYTVHMEVITTPSLGPVTNSLPGLNTNGYTVTGQINPPIGSIQRIAVLVEWTDTNITNTTFEGTAREIMRVGFSSNIHPMGDLLYNPLAHPGDSDYRNLYIANGDGGAGEAVPTHFLPQRLDTLSGKILRITPDLNLRPADDLSINGRYRIPTTGLDPNPFSVSNSVFTNIPGARKEIFAYGFRNCHRITWDPVSNQLIENDIGLHSWEEVNLIHKGLNYGYAEREGTEQLFVTGNSTNGKTGSQVGVAFPVPDLLTVTGLVNQVTPTYPVANYSHKDGDAISSGLVYRGKLLPQLQGKYIFGDITTGRIFYSDLNEMIATDDGIRTNTAAVHEIQIVFQSPYTGTNYPVQRRLFDIVSEEFHARGGSNNIVLPGSATATGLNDPSGVPYGGGRSDIRLAAGDDGEIYILSKSDGMIRKVTSVLAPPILQAGTLYQTSLNLTWPVIPNRTYRVQSRNSLVSANWADLTGDLTTTNLALSFTNTPATNAVFYRISLLP
jgi:hypothetical protein